MQKRFLSMFVGVVLCLLCMSPTLCFADGSEVVSNEEMCSRMYDQTIFDFGLSGDTGESPVYFVYGVRCGSNIPVSSLVYNGSIYICEYDPGKDTYSTSSAPTSTFSLRDSFVRAGYDEYFYFNPSDYYDDTYDIIQFHYCYTDNVRITETYPDDSRFKIYTFSTFEDISEGLKSLIGGSSGSTDSTENPPFQLPDDWLNGGNTLETPSSPSFDGIDFDSSYDEFENITDFEFDSSFLSSVSFFWSVVIGIIDAFDFWLFVYASMTISLLAFILGRNI